MGLSHVLVASGPPRSVCPAEALMSFIAASLSYREFPGKSTCFSEASKSGSAPHPTVPAPRAPPPCPGPSHLSASLPRVCRTCPTRTGTGTRPVSVARGVGAPSWTSRSLPRRTSCSALTATRKSTRREARSARRASCQVGAVIPPFAHARSPQALTPQSLPTPPSTPHTRAGPGAGCCAPCG